MIWKPIPRLKRYEASNTGLIRRISDGKLFAGCLAHGYRIMTLDGVRCQAHRLIYEAFCGPITPGNHINHKNSIRHDNRLSNLEDVTAKQNVHHALGLRHHKAIYTLTVQEAGRIMGRGPSTIRTLANYGYLRYRKRKVPLGTLTAFRRDEVEWLAPLVKQVHADGFVLIGTLAFAGVPLLWKGHYDVSYQCHPGIKYPEWAPLDKKVLSFRQPKTYEV